MIGPATITVLLLAGVLLVVGAIVLGSSSRPGRPCAPRRAAGAADRCPQCHGTNPGRAQFCAHCGTRLINNDAEPSNTEN